MEMLSEMAEDLEHYIDNYLRLFVLSERKVELANASEETIQLAIDQARDQALESFSANT